MDVFKQKGLPSTFPPPGTQHAHSFSTAVVKYSTINMRPYVAGYVYGRDLVGMQVLVAVTGTLGALVILSLLGYLAFCALSTQPGPKAERAKATRRFLSTDLGSYLLLLFFFDFLGDLTTMANFYWAMQGMNYMSPLCTWQGALTEWAFMGVVMANFMLAKATADVILLSRKPSGWERLASFFAIFAIPTFLTVIGPATTPDGFSFYGPAAMSCFQTIGSTYFQTIVFCTAALGAFINGYMGVVYMMISKKLKARQTMGAGSQEMDSRLRRVATQMIFYPVTYLALTSFCTLSILLTGSGLIVPPAFLCVSLSVLTLLSLSDVTIFVITRQSLIQPGAGDSTDPSRSDTALSNRGPPSKIESHELEASVSKSPFAGIQVHTVVEQVRDRTSSDASRTSSQTLGDRASAVEAVPVPTPALEVNLLVPEISYSAPSRSLNRGSLGLGRNWKDLKASDPKGESREGLLE